MFEIALNTPLMKKSDSHFLKKVGFISFNESSFKMMKNVFYFMLKALFVLEIFVLSFFRLEGKRLDKKAN